MVEPIADNAIDLFWTDNSDDEALFQIERSTSSGTGYSLIDSVSANQTNYTDLNLSPATTYWYRIRAVNEVGNSDYTSPASGATFSALPSPVELNDGVLSHWKLNETGDATIRIDSSGSINLVPRGAGTPGAEGHIDGSVDCNENGLESSGFPFNFANHSFTIATWVNSATWDGSSSLQRLIATKGNADAQEWQVDWVDTASPVADRLRFQLKGRDDATFYRASADNFGAVTPRTNEWLLIIAWHDALNDLIGIEVNASGANTTSVIGGGAGTATAIKFGLGTRDGGGLAAFNNINGYMDSTTIWDRVLSPAERALLWNDGDGLDFPFPASGAGGGGDPGGGGSPGSQQGNNSLFLFF